MAIKLKIPAASAGSRNPLPRIVIAATLILGLLFFAVFAFYYVRYDRIISAKMSGQIFSTSAKIYARPVSVRPGDHMAPGQIATRLRRAGYQDSGGGADAPMGTFHMIPGGIEVLPGPESYHSTEGARILTGPDGNVERILGVGANSGADLGSYALEPELVTALFRAGPHQAPDSYLQ